MASERDQLMGSRLSTTRQGEVQLRLARIAAVGLLFIVLGGGVVLVMHQTGRATGSNGLTAHFDPTTIPTVGSRDIAPREQLCDDGRYSRRTLKKAYEMPFAALFKDSRGQKKFEASDVIKVGDYLYAVCDSSWAISKFGSSLLPFSESNVQIGDPQREKDEDSGYEGIVHSEGIFYVVRESVLHDATSRVEESYHAIVEELQLSDSDYTILAQCPSEFEFEGDSKGFEGAIGITDLKNTLTIIGLCEGNHCSQKRKADRGNGKLVVMQKSVNSDGSCIWKTVRIISIPPSAPFLDYSAITVDETGRVAISSQEDSQVWIGQLVGMQANGNYDIRQLALVDAQEGRPELYNFPMNDDCGVVYCNIEGIHWLDKNMLIAVSDKMKSKGKQAYRCFDKDQSVHAFVLP